MLLKQCALFWMFSTCSQHLGQWFCLQINKIYLWDIFYPNFFLIIIIIISLRGDLTDTSATTAMFWMLSKSTWESDFVFGMKYKYLSLYRTPLRRNTWYTDDFRATEPCSSTELFSFNRNSRHTGLCRTPEQSNLTRHIYTVIPRYPGPRQAGFSISRTDFHRPKIFKSFLPWCAGFRLPRAAIKRTLSRLILTESGRKRGTKKHKRAAWRPLSTYSVIWHDAARIATCFEEAKDDACIYDKSKALAYRIAREQSRIQACIHVARLKQSATPIASASKM